MYLEAEFTRARPLAEETIATSSRLINMGLKSNILDTEGAVDHLSSLICQEESISSAKCEELAQALRQTEKIEAELLLQGLINNGTLSKDVLSAFAYKYDLAYQPITEAGQPSIHNDIA